jgi:Tfp pilus assembly protein PilF
MVLGACAANPQHPATVESNTSDSRTEAEALAIRAGALIATDRPAAESLLHEALTKDPYCGIAHNNLGTLHLTANPPDLFAAAESFQTAAKLMPGRPDPHMNLGLVMERAARLDEALAAYTSAVEAAPGNMPAIQALTSLEIRLGKSSEQTHERLKAIALGGTSSAWRSWAQERLLQQPAR